MPNRRLVNLPSATTPLTGNELYYAVSSANVDVKVLGSQLGAGGGTPGGLNTQLQYNNNGVFGGLTDIQVTSRIQSFSSALSGAAPASPGGTATFLRADGTWNAPPVSSAGNPPGGSSGQVQINNGGAAFGAISTTQLTALINQFTSALPGDVPASGGGSANFLRADGTWSVPASTGAGSPGGSSGNVQINNGGGSFGGLTNTQLTADINVFSSALSGATPASGGGSVNFLRADGSWAVPASTGAGTPGGSSGQVQINNGGGSFAGITNTQLTADINLFSSIASGTVTASSSFGALAFLRADNTFSTTLGSTGSPTPAGTGSLTLVGASSGSVTIISASAGSVYNFQLPTTAGSSGQLLQSSTAATTPMAWSYTPTLGSTGASGATGSLTLLGISSGAVTVRPSSLSATYSFILPQTAGSSGQLLQSSTAGVTPMAWSYTPTLGSTNPANTGSLTLVGNSSGSVTILPSSMGAIYNFNLPTTAGVAGQVIQSQGGGSLPMLWTYTPTIGSAGNATGALNIKGITSGIVTVTVSTAAGTFNFNLPTTAGTAGQVLTSGGGGTAPMTWGAAGITTESSAIPVKKGSYPTWDSTTGTTVVDGRSMLNVLAFGADPSGTNASDTAFANALTAVSAIFGSLYIPAGTYKLTAAWLVNVGNIRIYGDCTGTIIKQSTLNASVITVTGSDVILEGLSLTYSSPASTGAVALQVGTGSFITDTRVNNLWFSNCYHAININAENTGYFRNINITTTTGTALGLSNAASNINVDNCTFGAGSTPPSSTSIGLSMTGACQGNNFTNIELSNWWFPAIIGGGASGIANNPAFCKFVNVYFDSGVREAYFAEMYECDFTNCWFSNGAIAAVSSVGSSPGCNIVAGSGIHLRGGQAYNCGSHGYIVDAGVSNVTFNGVSAISNSHSAGSGVAHGITISAGISDFSIIGCVCKNITSESSTANQGWGIIVVASTNDRYIIQGNLVTPNVTGGVSDGGTGLNKSVTANF